MAPTIKNFGELLGGITPGAWVAISHDETRVVAYAAEMRDAIQKAHEAGEANPIITRVPQTSAAFVL
jgi:hypothetical protein